MISQEGEPRQEPADLLSRNREAAKSRGRAQVGLVRLADEDARELAVDQLAVDAQKRILGGDGEDDDVGVGEPLRGRRLTSRVSELGG